MGLSQFDYVLTLLVNRMLPPEWYTGTDGSKAYRRLPGDVQKRKMVFLLGAGCSRQYGLPSFVELLIYLWEDCLRRLPEPPLSLEVLRDQLDTFWQAQGPEDRRGMLSFYLGDRVNGSTCPGYLHLARLAEKGYVKAIVNMNFDTLLEQALDFVKVPYEVATSFLLQDDKKVMIYKPHGTIGWVDPEDTVDGLLRIVQKLIELSRGGASPERREVLQGIFLRARQDFLNERKDLSKSSRDIVKATEALINMCGNGLDDFGPHSPQPALVKALADLIEKNRDPVRVKNDLILDIANSDLFSDPGEQKRAQELLTQNDVISIGYSGVDAKIASALRAFSPDLDPKDRKLFLVNVARPDPRILLVMAERGSQDLLVTGQDAAFENFMRFLFRKVERWQREGDKALERPIRRAAGPQMSYMTRPERKALKACLKMALDIRLAMNVAEHSRMSIEEHGRRIFADCLDLARQAGICLSSPEKYLLHCAAFLHDLGYYRGYSRSKAPENPGWTLLRRHGILTKELLKEAFRENPEVLRSITPVSYEEGEISFEKLLCALCEGHSGLVEIESIEDSKIRVDGVEVPVRFELILALFALAEDLAEGHPFLPSPDPVGPAQESGWAIVDPVLALYLRSGRPVEFVVERRRIIVHKRDGKRPAMTSWLLAMADLHIRRFDSMALRKNGWGICLSEPSGLPNYEELPAALDHIEGLLRLALYESLDEALQEVKPNAPGEASSLLDLISIYTMSTGGGERAEPRIPLAKPYQKISQSNALDRALHRTREALNRQGAVAQQGLLQHYLLRKGKIGASPDRPLDRLFLESFERIIYPAWRFFARNWHDGIETLLMARACFDLGSSRFRGETLGGVKILDEQIRGDDEWAYGHQRCTLCTSRLLYVLTNARRLFPASEYPRLDRKIRAILSYMLSLAPDDEIWWGLEPSEGWKNTIHSADYLTWAARSVSFCLSVDLEFQDRLKERWLVDKCGLDESELRRLLRDRWEHLLTATDLLTERAEEPHSYIFGRVAIACIDLLRLDSRLRSATGDNLDGKIRAMTENLTGEAKGIGVLSQMSKFNLWPLQLLLDATRLSDTAAVAAIDICYECVHSPVWIKGGGDNGSWGFNVKNTQTIVTSLVEFWRYALRDDTQEERFAKLFEDADRKHKN